jgi:hypothetical protein
MPFTHTSSRIVLDLNRPTVINRGLKRCIFIAPNKNNHMKLSPIRFAGLLFMTLAILVSSCSKDDDEQKLTKTQMLTRKWKQSDLLISENGASFTSIFNFFFDECEKDNIWEFKADGSVVVTEGNSKCDSSDPDVVASGTWAFAENETKLVISVVGEPSETLTIGELTATSLKLSTEQDYLGTPVDAILVFTAL